MTLPDLDADGSQLADWLELEALVRAQPVPFVALNAANEALEESEPEDLDHEDIRADERVQRCATVISHRGATLKESYPFKVVDRGNCLEPLAEQTDGRAAYIFCLIASNLAPGGHLKVKDQDAQLQTVRRLMQICSTIAVAGHQVGPAFSLGWPRSDSSSFLKKLRQIYRAYGDGEIVTRVPKGVSKSVKDDGIDVIGWKYLDGDLPSQSYMLLQAASGRNWEDKSTKELRDTFHGTWFRKQPAASTQAAIGIAVPFALYENDDRETAKGEHRRHALKFGEMMTRTSLPAKVEAGLKLAVHHNVDDHEQFEELRKFNEAVIEALSA